MHRSEHCNTNRALDEVTTSGARYPERDVKGVIVYNRFLITHREHVRVARKLESFPHNASDRPSRYPEDASKLSHRWRGHHLPEWARATFNWYNGRYMLRCIILSLGSDINTGVFVTQGINHTIRETSSGSFCHRLYVRLAVAAAQAHLFKILRRWYSAIWR